MGYRLKKQNIERMVDCLAGEKPKDSKSQEVTPTTDLSTFSDDNLTEQEIVQLLHRLLISYGGLNDGTQDMLESAESWKKVFWSGLCYGWASMGLLWFAMWVTH